MTTRFIPSAGDTEQPVPGPDLAYFRAVLAEQRAFRIEQLRDLDAATLSPHHELAALSEVSAALRTAARAALAEVDAALKRLAIGEYGLCQSCGDDIALVRLEIVPMAALCMHCQRLGESVAEVGGLA